MVRPTARVSRSLTVRLAVLICLTVVVWTAVAGTVAFRRALHEAHQTQDGTLQQVATLVRVAPHGAIDLAGGSSTDPAADIVIQTVGARDDADHAADFPADLTDGLHTITVDDAQARVAVRTLPSGQRIVASQSVSARDEIARDAALSAVVPLLALLPVLLIVIVLITGVLLSPIQRLAAELAGRGDADLRPVATAGVPSELVGFLTALNRLLSRSADVLDGQRRFAAEAAHELRTPIAAVSLQAEHLALARSDEERMRRLTTLQHGLARVRHLCEQLIDLARSEGTDTRVASVWDTVSALCVDLEPAVTGKDLDLDVDLAIDRDLLVPELPATLALRNVLTNAVRYTPAGGHIRVTATADEREVRVDVVDDGPGITDPHAVLAPFHREADQSVPGSGLGLAITERALAGCGGRLELAAAGPTSGTRATVWVPLVHAHLPLTADHATPGGRAPARGDTMGS